MPHPRRAVTVCLLALVAASAVGVTRANPPDGTLVAVAPSAPPVAAAPAPPPPTARPAPPGLPKIAYSSAPTGFPPDPAPASLTAVTAGLHPERKLAVYDAPGGHPRAFLPRSISGLSVVVPIVARRTGWTAVLLPSANRRIGWLPDTGWSPRPLRDQLVLRRRTHELTWLRDGRPRETWRVSVGTKSTPTPLGRTFVLGRTGTRGSVYGGLDALVLGAVPENRGALAPGLRDAHTGIHGWIRSSAFGRSISNGCVRMPPKAQRTLLDQVGPGTTVHVID
jgi:hypothetical protein